MHAYMCAFMKYWASSIFSCLLSSIGTLSSPPCYLHTTLLLVGKSIQPMIDEQFSLVPSEKKNMRNRKCRSQRQEPHKMT